MLMLVLALGSVLALVVLVAMGVKSGLDLGMGMVFEGSKGEMKEEYGL